MEAHIIWDWNGTLLDDFHISLKATNVALMNIDVLPLNSEEYRSLYCVPVYDFYRKVLGRKPTLIEWENIGKKFSTIYKHEILDAPLAKDVLDLLHKRRRHSICSLMERDLLIKMLESFGISSHFTEIHGRTTPLATEGKYAHLKQHVNNLINNWGVKKEEIVVIGDTADDADSAQELGLASILYSGGTFNHQRLAATGKPVVNTLIEAVTLADYLVKEKKHV
ncbi:phosphoglycolate phosphatase [Vibrio qinghaiensis]|jgi:phosphoglycolate phosphatase-like HAD superfamily hydrolase|uniref:phosphoglycolate phosphatase n=1 Tax=Vibrio qinghaiensis TaxID=2025808 RepID=A0A223N3X8_9VIBR|nr:HAD hydrolase-like protein [Vibrio qinghaiensis]ASU24380.1 phosphoglycolate phosphatase [Vibrio qinghaiensis]